MMDIHSHMLFGVDDGPSTLEGSLKMVAKAVEAGFQAVIATPHFEIGITETSKVLDNFQELCAQASDYELTLMLGYEVRLDLSLKKIIKDLGRLTLNSSNYLLVELPFDYLPLYSYDLLYELQLNGIIPILAHPERYEYFLRDPDLMENYFQAGCPLQLDAGSVLGKYGERVYTLARKLLLSGRVDFVASDAHSESDYADSFKKAFRKITKWTGADNTDRMFCSAARLIR